MESPFSLGTDFFLCMAYFHYQSETDTDCLLTSFKSLLENAGLNVSGEFSNSAQVFAEFCGDVVNFRTIVKVLISWSDKTSRVCSIEIRSDEPLLTRNTCCEKVAKKLHDLIPPKNNSH